MPNTPLTPTVGTATAPFEYDHLENSVAALRKSIANRLVYGVGKDLAVEDKWPNWYEGNPFKAARDTMMKAEPAKQ